MREAAMRRGRGRRPSEANFSVEMGRLRAWLVSYPYPSQGTVDRFFTSSLYRDLETVAPGNAAGNSLLQTLRNVYGKDHKGAQLPTQHGRTATGQGGTR